MRGNLADVRPNQIGRRSWLGEALRFRRRGSNAVGDPVPEGPERSSQVMVPDLVTESACGTGWNRQGCHELVKK